MKNKDKKLFNNSDFDNSLKKSIKVEEIKKRIFDNVKILSILSADFLPHYEFVLKTENKYIQDKKILSINITFFDFMNFDIIKGMQELKN